MTKRKKMSLLKTVCAVGVIALAVPGCAVKQPQMITLVSSFDGATAQKMLGEGNNTIKGSALMRQNNGGVVTCAGRKVTLIPVTAYAIERMNYMYGNSNGGILLEAQQFMSPRQFANTDPNYMSAVRESLCDAQGYFKFDKVADGEFFITTGITWKVGTNSLYQEGGYLMRRVELRGGDIKEIVLAP